MVKKVVKKVKKEEKEPKILWQFKCYSGLLKKLISRVGNLNDEIKIDIDENGISTKTVDPSHVAMVYLSIPKKDFYTGHTAVNKNVAFKIAEAFSIGIDLDKLSKTLKLMSDYDYIDGRVEKNSLYLDTDKIHKKILLIDTFGMPEPKLPTIEFNVKAEVSGSDLSLLIKAMDTFSDYFTLVADKTGLYSIIEDDEDNLKIDLSTNVKGMGKALFSCDYFKNIIGGLGWKHVKFEFSTDNPIRVSGELGDSGKFEYLLAPRIEGEK